MEKEKLVWSNAHMEINKFIHHIADNDVWVQDEGGIGTARIRVVDTWVDDKGETYLRVLEIEDCPIEERLYAMYNFTLADYIRARNAYLNNQ